MTFITKKKVVKKTVPKDEDIVIDEEEVEQEVEQEVEEEIKTDEPHYDVIEVVEKLPLKEVRYQTLEDGTVIKFITVLESLTELMNFK